MLVLYIYGSEYTGESKSLFFRYLNFGSVPSLRALVDRNACGEH